MKQKLGRILTVILLLVSPYAAAKTADSKNFPAKTDNIYMMSLNALTKLNFSIDEMQSSSGYILFKIPNGARYLLVVSDCGNNISNVKISKFDSNAPLYEIQDIVYNAITEELNNVPKRAE